MKAIDVIKFAESTGLTRITLVHTDEDIRGPVHGEVDQHQLVTDAGTYGPRADLSDFGFVKAIFKSPDGLP